MGSTRGGVGLRWRGLAAVAVLGSLVVAGCGDDDANDPGTATEADADTGTGTDAGTDTEADGEDASTDPSSGATGAATVGTTVYAFVPGDGAFCRVSETDGAISASGLVHLTTGAELTVDYSSDSKDTATVTIRSDEMNLESSSVVSPAPPGFVIQGNRATGGGQFIDVDDPGSDLLDGQIVVTCP